MLLTISISLLKYIQSFMSLELSDFEIFELFICSNALWNEDMTKTYFTHYFHAIYRMFGYIFQFLKISLLDKNTALRLKSKHRAIQQEILHINPDKKLSLLYISSRNFLFIIYIKPVEI